MIKVFFKHLYQISQLIVQVKNFLLVYLRCTTPKPTFIKQTAYRKRNNYTMTSYHVSFSFQFFFLCFSNGKATQISTAYKRIQQLHFTDFYWITIKEIPPIGHLPWSPSKCCWRTKIYSSCSWLCWLVMNFLETLVGELSYCSGNKTSDNILTLQYIEGKVLIVI